MRRPFISYAREDSEIAARLHDDLRRAGTTPWLDRRDIRAGEIWRDVIREALRSATHVIALISQNSVNKRGYVQHELQQALELLEEIPPGQIFIIPVRLDRSEPRHSRLNDLHRVDLFEGYEAGLEKILDSLRATSRSSITPITQPNVDRVAAMIAHEMNNVMMSIVPFLGIIGRKADHDDHVQNSLAAINRAIARGKRLTMDVLSIARPQSFALHAVSIADWLARNAAELHAIAGDRAKLEIREIQRDLEVQGDEIALMQVLTNLVTNAVQAIDGNGEIVIGATPALVGSNEKRMICIAVADNGKGIDPDTLPRIFEPFYTTKVHGSGIGLALCHNIVAAHNGAIDVASVVGQGTTFSIFLPAIS